MLKNKLRMLREKTGLTQKEFASKFNMSDARYNHYETGKREPDYDTLKSFADFFEVSTDFLLGRTDIDNSTIDEEFSELLNDPELLVAFKDISSLSENDKKEIINFIKFKKNNN